MEWWIWLLIGVVVAVAVLVIVSRLRRERLREQFGSEYDRTIGDAEHRWQAEHDLRGRVKRHRKLELRPLDPDTAARYSQEWMTVQAHFVDAPEEACAQGESLLERVLRDRGYPVDEDFDTQADLVSVDHPELVADYRRTHEMLHSEQTGEQRTEELRTIFTVHRDLFSDLLGATPPADRPQEEDGRADLPRNETGESRSDIDAPAR